jgi:hypothetical protein
MDKGVARAEFLNEAAAKSFIETYDRRELDGEDTAIMIILTLTFKKFRC